MQFGKVKRRKVTSSNYASKSNTEQKFFNEFPSKSTDYRAHSSFSSYFFFLSFFLRSFASFNFPLGNGAPPPPDGWALVDELPS